MKRRSLSVKLLFWTLAALSGYIAIIGTLAYWSTRSNIADVYDNTLVINANTLLYITVTEISEGEMNETQLDITDEHLPGGDKEAFNEFSDFRIFRIWHENDVILKSSSLIPDGYPEFPEGFSDRTINGVQWRIYSLHVPGKGLAVEMAEQQRARAFVISSILGDLIYPFLLSLPIAAFLFWRAICAGMIDLHQVTRQVKTRSPDRMVPLDAARTPPDLLPLVEAVNTLLARLNRSLMREREITDLAAHELRTPLTAIKLQAQIGLKATRDEDRVQALNGLLVAVERGTHLVDQLLTLTRVEQSSFDLVPVDVRAVTERVIESLSPLTNSRTLTVTANFGEDLAALGNTDLLNVTLTNLLNNAVKYAPPSSQVRVSGRRQNGAVIVEVIDEGPGIPDKVRERVFERFFRHYPGSVIGSGLGLTIAHQCADRMQATLSLHSPPSGHGLCVRLSLEANP